VTKREADGAVVRHVDAELVASVPLGERLVQRLVEAANGTGSCTVSWIRTPAGGGSPEGLHVHPVDQLLYVLAGTVTIEARGATRRAGPGSLALFPAGLPHRSWNEGPDPTVHLSINVPAPPADVPFVQHVAEDPAADRAARAVRRDPRAQSAAGHRRRPSSSG
jgi:quercetin dioxygenase-like cupin family protein